MQHGPENRIPDFDLGISCPYVVFRKKTMQDNNFLGRRLYNAPQDHCKI
jgi:hypothetical protein